MKIQAKKDDAQSSSSDGIHHSGLEKRQKVLSVVFLVQSSASLSICFLSLVFDSSEHLYSYRSH